MVEQKQRLSENLPSEALPDLEVWVSRITDLVAKAAALAERYAAMGPTSGRERNLSHLRWAVNTGRAAIQRLARSASPPR